MVFVKAQDKKKKVQNEGFGKQERRLKDEQSISCIRSRQCL